MTSHEKMHWFWAFGQVPGSVFDDLHDRKSKGLKLPHVHRYKGLPPDLRTWRHTAGKENGHT
jgi:hypothetical protein